MRKLITPAEFRTLQRSTPGPVDGIVHTFAAEIEKAADPASRQLTFTISTGEVDRKGDTIAVNGWSLENYQANPVVLWAHQSRDLPIARAIKVWKHSGKLKATAEFVPADMPVAGPLAEAVYQMYKGGFLNATSVGMMPLEWKWATEEPRASQYGIDFLEQELLEFSAVPIPANPSALVEAKSAGIDVSPVLIWARGIVAAGDKPGPHAFKGSSDRPCEVCGERDTHRRHSGADGKPIQPAAARFKSAARSREIARLAL